MKGNSERVPRKNVRLLNNKPVCHWILESLTRSDYIDEIIVNTDSEEIKEVVSIFQKVRIVDRPDYLKGDKISIQPLIEYDLKFARNNYILQTHSTNPLLSTDTIDQAIKTFLSKENENDALVSVTPQKVRFYFKDGKPVNHDPDNLIQTQLLEPIYEENSCIYIFSKETNLKVKNRLGRNPQFFEMEHIEAVDIDEWHDFHWAEYLLKQNKS